MENKRRDEKIVELEKRIKELERILAYHYHDAMGSASIGNAAVWFKSMGPFRK